MGSADALRQMRKMGYPSTESEDNGDDGMSSGGRMIKLTQDELKMCKPGEQCEFKITGTVNEKGELTIMSLSAPEQSGQGDQGMPPAGQPPMGMMQ